MIHNHVVVLNVALIHVWVQSCARKPRIVHDVGHWELKRTKSKMARGSNAEGMAGLSLVFHLFSKVSSDYRWIKQ